jgi:hypothetical protein
MEGNHYITQPFLGAIISKSDSLRSCCSASRTFADSRERCDTNGYKKENLFSVERTSAKLTFLLGNLLTKFQMCSTRLEKRKKEN